MSQPPNEADQYRMRAEQAESQLTVVQAECTHLLEEKRRLTDRAQTLIGDLNRQEQLLAIRRDAELERMQETLFLCQVECDRLMKTDQILRHQLRQAEDLLRQILTVDGPIFPFKEIKEYFRSYPSL